MTDLVIDSRGATNRTWYVATAGQTVFQLPFQFFEDSDVAVWYKADGTQPDPTSDKLPASAYVVTGADAQYDDPRYITLVTPAVVGAAVVVDREVPEEQLVDFTVGGKYKQTTIDFVNNKLTTLIQQGTTKLETRGLLYPVTALTSAGQTTLPVLGANEYWQANALGNLQAVTIAENSDWSTLRSQLLSQTQAAPGTDLIGYYDTVLSIGTTLTSFLNTLNVEYNLIKDGIPSTGFATLFIGNLSYVKTGWIMMDDGSIGDALSLATNRANADTEDLFKMIWESVIDAWAPVSGGRGASAQDDFDNNKNITLTRQLGRALCVAGGGAGLPPSINGEFLGESQHQTSEIESASHTHNVSRSYGGGATSIQPSGGGGAATDVVTSSTGGDLPHNNMQPSAFWNVIIKL